jgi:predicted secreted protein
MLPPDAALFYLEFSGFLTLSDLIAISIIYEQVQLSEQVRLVVPHDLLQVIIILCVKETPP